MFFLLQQSPLRLINLEEQWKDNNIILFVIMTTAVTVTEERMSKKSRTDYNFFFHAIISCFGITCLPLGFFSPFCCSYIITLMRYKKLSLLPIIVQHIIIFNHCSRWFFPTLLLAWLWSPSFPLVLLIVSHLPVSYPTFLCSRATILGRTSGTILHW